MKTKNPYESEDVQELKEIGFYWMQIYHYRNLEKKAILSILRERNVNILIDEIISHMNTITQSESKEWQEKKP